MANYAVIENGIITNLIVAENITTATEITQMLCIEVEDVTQLAIGWTYNGSTFEQPATE